MTEYKKHYSVLKKEIIDFFKDVDLTHHQKNFADLTFGAGGHSLEIVNTFSDANLYSFDQDAEAIKNGRGLVKENSLENRLNLIHSNFSFFKDCIGEKLFSGALLDAGVSSHQFDEPKRGFSFRFEADLDMRMNQDSELTAYKIVNEYTGEDLERILYDYGEERFTKVIVKNILEKRSAGPIETTKDMEDLCFHSYPKKLRYEGIHPATKTFQALRIEVNNELGVLSDVIDQVIDSLEIGGVFAVISFHSLEDRIVKRSFKKRLEMDLPVQILTKKPILPSEQEIFENSRSRSAKLRVIKRVEEWPSKNKYSRK